MIRATLPFVGNGSNIYHLGHIFGATNPRYNDNYVPTSLEEITLLNTCKVIGTYAFYECFDIEKVNLNEGITAIESYAFEYCYFLKNINILNSINKIGSYAFNQCISLDDIKIFETINFFSLDETEISHYLTTGKIIFFNSKKMLNNILYEFMNLQEREE